MVTARNLQVISETFNITSISTNGHCAHNCSPYLFLYIFFMARQPLMSQGLLNVEAPRSYSDTPHAAELLWTSDRPVAETTDNTQYLRTHRYPCPRRDSNLQSQQASSSSSSNSSRPTPNTARPLGPAPEIYSYYCLLRQHENTSRHCFNKRTVTVCATTREQ